MKFIITESQLESTIFKFLDTYLDINSPEESESLIVFGKGREIAYEKGDKLLMVRDRLFQKIKNLFNLSTSGARKIFIEYIESKGLKIKRFV